MPGMGLMLFYFHFLMLHFSMCLVVMNRFGTVLHMLRMIMPFRHMMVFFTAGILIRVMHMLVIH
jgi:hypothetical protein